MMKYKINSTGNITLADQAFMDAVYPNDYTQLPDDPVPAPVVLKHITVGRFFDRFGAQKYPILADSNPMVQALIKDCSVRSYIDLDDPQLPYGLQMLVESGHAIDVQGTLTAPLTDIERP